MSADIESMFSVREVPWHGLGTVVNEAVSSKEAIRLAGLDWTVVQRDISDSVTGEIIPKFKANVREMDNKVLGIVSDSRYTICQNADAFEFTDKLLGEGVQYETAGSLLGGRRIWLLAKLEDRDILGDQFAPYLVFTNAHDGSGSVRVAVSPVRVVCQNTLNLALKRAERSWSCVHRGNLQDKLQEAVNTLGRANKYLGKLEYDLKELSLVEFDETRAEKYVSELLPFNKSDSEKKKENTQAMRDEIIFRYKEAPDLDRLPGGSYRLLNAVSDFATHSEPFRKTKYYKENLFLRTINGNNLVDKAYQILREAA